MGSRFIEASHFCRPPGAGKCFSSESHHMLRSEGPSHYTGPRFCDFSPAPLARAETELRQWRLGPCSLAGVAWGTTIQPHCQLSEAWHSSSSLRRTVDRWADSVRLGPAVGTCQPSTSSCPAKAHTHPALSLQPQASGDPQDSGSPPRAWLHS